MKKFVQKIVAFTQTRYMKVLMDGFMGVAAITIAGSIFNLIKSIPIDPWQEFLISSGLVEILSIPISITTNLMAVYIVLSMSYHLAKSFNKNGFTAAIISFGAFIILTPLVASNVTFNPETGEQVVTTVTNALSLTALGSQGIFLAIVVGLVASRLYIFFMDRGWRIKMPDSIPPNVSNMFADMIPGGLVFIFFLVIRWGLGLTEFGTAQALIYSILQAPLMNVTGGLGGVIVYLVMIKVFWLFGVHGGMIVNSAMYSIVAAASASNVSAFASGGVPPFPDWAIGPVISAGIGVLSLNLLMLFAKSKQFKALAKIALPTSLFGITEPMMFGTPMILNVFFAIPFILSPLITLMLIKVIMAIGLLASPTGAMGNMFIPSPISLALLTADWKGLIWGFALILANMALYYPFFMVADRKALREESVEQIESN